MNYQWYPGHMTKAVRQMQEDIKLIDLVIEIIDARIPFSSRNPDIDKLAQNKSRVIILNKSDLSDSKVNALWKEHFEKNGIFVLEADSRNGKTLNKLNDLVKEACAEKIERDRKRGIINRPLRAMVVGIPNVGKSTFINSFAGKACAKTGNKPGVTKGKQWIRLGKGLELLDTPGILWPKFDSPEVGEHLALIGAINDEIIHTDELAMAGIKFLIESYPNLLSERYDKDLDMSKKGHEILSDLAVSRNLMAKGGVPDIDRIASVFIEELRSGKIGRISIERP